MTHSLGKKIGIASAILMGSVFLSRVIGLFREMAVAYVGGLDASVDAYVVAFILPDIFNHITAGGFFSVTFIPIFSGYLARNRELEGWRIMNIILHSFGLLLLVLVILGMAFTPELVAITAEGRPDAAFRAMVVRMTRIILPAQLFHLIGGLLMAVQYSKERFLVPALSPLVYNLGIILGGLLLGPVIGMEGFCWGVLAGAFLGPFLLQIWGARRVGLRYRFLLEPGHPEFVRYMKLTLPLMLGLTMMFSMEIFLKYFGAYLPEGSVAGLNFSKTVLLIPAGLFGYAVGTASFPFMARLANENRIGEMNRLINTALRYLSLVLPFSILLIVLRRELVMILFERGRFDADATALTAGILAFLLPCAVALSSYTVVVRGFYAMQNTLFPAVFLTAAVLCSLPVYWYGMRWFGARGIASAVSLSVIFQVVLLYALWNHRTGNRESGGVYGLYLKVLLISIPVGALAEWFRRWAFPPPEAAGTAEALGAAAATGAAYALLFLLAGRLAKIREIEPLLERAARVLPWRHSGNSPRNMH